MKAFPNGCARVLFLASISFLLPCCRAFFISRPLGFTSGRDAGRKTIGDGRWISVMTSTRRFGSNSCDPPPPKAGDFFESKQIVLDHTTFCFESIAYHDPEKSNVVYSIEGTSIERSPSRFYWTVLSENGMTEDEQSNLLFHSLQAFEENMNECWTHTTSGRRIVLFPRHDVGGPDEQRENDAGDVNDSVSLVLSSEEIDIDASTLDHQLLYQWDGSIFSVYSALQSRLNSRVWWCCLEPGNPFGSVAHLWKSQQDFDEFRSFSAGEPRTVWGRDKVMFLRKILSSMQGLLDRYHCSIRAKKHWMFFFVGALAFFRCKGCIISPFGMIQTIQTVGYGATLGLWKHGRLYFQTLAVVGFAGIATMAKKSPPLRIESSIVQNLTTLSIGIGSLAELWMLIAITIPMTILRSTIGSLTIPKHRLFQRLIMAPLKEEFAFRFLYDKVGGGLWVSGLLFAGMHMSNWLPIRKEHPTFETFQSFDAKIHILLALGQSTCAFVASMHLLTPLYLEKGVFASIGAHMAVNALPELLMGLATKAAAQQKDTTNDEI